MKLSFSFQIIEYSTVVASARISRSKQEMPAQTTSEGNTLVLAGSVASATRYFAAIVTPTSVGRKKRISTYFSQ